MPRAKIAAHLSGLVGSDSEPDFDDFDTIGTATTRNAGYPMPAAKKTRGRPVASNKVTKPAPKTTRRSSGRITAAVQTHERKALADKSNANAPQISSSDETKSQSGRTTKDKEAPAPKAQPKATRGRPRAAKVQPDVADSIVEEVVPSARRGRPPTMKSTASLPVEIPETQLSDPMDLEEDLETPVGVEELSHIPSDPISGDLAADLDGTDTSLRRRLGDLTRKYESLEKRHRDLREVGVKEAERLYERLKKQSEENTAASNQLVTKLKEQIAAQSSLLKQGELKQQLLDRSEAEVANLEEHVAKLTGALTEAKSEIKTLSMKLTASRTAEANAKAPGSAMKTGSAGSRMAAAEAVQTALAKEDLYGDLTGLIIRTVKRDENDDIFDCIQTGRNGTLHFKLVLERPDASGDYEAADLTYRPQLDPARDEEMMKVLPGYLVEEITFPRPHASKFFARVIKSLNERLD